MIKKKLQEENDILLEIGKEGSEGDKLFTQYAQAKDKESKRKRENVLDVIDQTKKDKAYPSFLAGLLLKRLAIVDWEIGWKYKVAPTEVGVVMELSSPTGKLFRSAFRATTDPIADLNAIDMFALRAENTIDAQRYGNFK